MTKKSNGVARNNVFTSHTLSIAGWMGAWFPANHHPDAKLILKSLSGIMLTVTVEGGLQEGRSYINKRYPGL